MQSPNLVAVSEKIKEAVSCIDKKGAEILIKDSPLLCYKMAKIYDEKPISAFHYPFTKFRFSISSGDMTVNGFFKGLTGENGVLIFSLNSREFEKGDVVNDLIIALECRDPIGSVVYFVKVNGKHISVTDYIGKSVAKKLLWHAWKSFEVCVMDYMAPSNHIVSIRPEKQGKSVEWTKSREHYTIIHRSHSANNKKIPMGSTVEQNSGRTITRIAHSRRAHLRILRSPKFKRDANGDFKKLTIQESWVGPKEWRDGSGQIYKIVDKDLSCPISKVK